VAPEEEIVGFRPIDAADLVDIAEALSGQQSAQRSGPLQNGVDRDGRTVKEEARAGELRSGLRYPRLHAADQPVRGGERFSEA
jgi:hypothetical protein